jgi:excisionase family DNA binding protein
VNDLLTVAEAAARFRHSVSWLRRRIRAKQIPVYRPFGGQPRLKASDVDAVIEAGRVTPAATDRRRRSAAALDDLKQIARLEVSR